MASNSASKDKHSLNPQHDYHNSSKNLPGHDSPFANASQGLGKRKRTRAQSVSRHRAACLPPQPASRQGQSAMTIDPPGRSDAGSGGRSSFVSQDTPDDPPANNGDLGTGFLKVVKQDRGDQSALTQSRSQHLQEENSFSIATTRPSFLSTSQNRSSQVPHVKPTGSLVSVDITDDSITEAIEELLCPPPPIGVVYYPLDSESSEEEENEEKRHKRKESKCLKTLAEQELSLRAYASSKRQGLRMSSR